VQKITTYQIYRIVDANINRATEGLRVCEDICRFLLNDRAITAQYKRIRHMLSHALFGFRMTRAKLIESRNAHRDVGKESIPAELKRGNVYDIFYANSQRVKESIRVLEECLKLFDKKRAHQFKRARYAIYTLEQKVVKKF